MKKMILSLLLTAALVVSLHSSSVSAKHNVAENYTYLVGSGAICGLAPDACPDITMGKDGETITLTGEGSFNTQTGEATGGGTFIHKDSDGNILGEGDWHAMQLKSFRSWGSGVPQGTPPEFEGGRAKLLIHLAPNSGGEGFLATLKIICALGNFPEGAHDQEGFELSIKHGPNFKDQVSGFTVFIRQ